MRGPRRWTKAGRASILRAVNQSPHMNIVTGKAVREFSAADLARIHR
jgi:hypothetical protein